MGKGERIEKYIDDGEPRVAAASREELTHFRQDPPEDFTDPTQVVITKPGARRRTTITRIPLVEGAPNWKDGRRTGWYVVVDENGETALVSIQNANELANLPKEAMPAQEYCNLLAEENPTLAADLTKFLAQDANPHTAHHTDGVDMGERIKAIFAKNKLSHISYHDSKIGEGIKVPPVRHRPVHPSAIVGRDKVEW